MKKMFIGILMIVSMMFVGCNNQEVLEDVTIESSEEEQEERAVDYYGYDLRICNDQILLSDQFNKKQLEAITLRRYNKVLTLPESCFDSNGDMCKIEAYLLGSSDVLPDPDELTTQEKLENYADDGNSDSGSGTITNQSGDIYIQNHEPMKNGKPVKISRVVEPPVNSDWGDIPDNYLYLRCISCDEPFLTNDLSKERCSDCENAIEIDLSNLLYCDECGQKQVDPDSGYCFSCGKEYFD